MNASASFDERLLICQRIPLGKICAGQIGVAKIVNSMKQFSRLFAWAWLTLSPVVVLFGQPVSINEIMYHPLQPSLGAEPLGEEFIELFNRGATNVDLSGWRFNKGVNFTFAPNTILAPGGYLVVSADLAVFAARHPGVANVVGPWVGTLANNGETIELKNAVGDVVDSVAYASEGDWAARQRGPNDLNHRGWKWSSPADGLGKSMERRNPNLTDDNGQNWAPSAGNGGTPGQVNSAVSANIAPLILNVSHAPVVPRSSQSVGVVARIVDDNAGGLTVTLHWRVDATSPPAFSTALMFDDGAHRDGAAGDGIYGAIIPAHPNDTVVEFYVEAMDSGGRANTWPGPVVAAPDGAGPTGQVANALYQVDDNTQNDYDAVAPNQPVLKLIMTENERAELQGIPCSGSQNSDAEMNGTFITLDGTGLQLRYRCGFRNRGHGSRCANPPNYRVSVPNDERWNGQSAMNVNAVNTPAQVLGATIAKKAGLPGGDSRAVQVRVNNDNRANTGTSMLGSYALNEELNADWANEHFPLDSAGNIYRAIRDISPPDWVYRGPNVSAYVNTYFKTDNSSAYDWSDLIQLHRIVGTNDLFTTANVRQVANVEEWCLYYAVMSLYGNNETSPNTGYNDDYFMYRGVNDPRFLLMYYDNDTILSGSYYGARSSSDGIFSAESNHGMGQMTSRFLEWPDFKPRYYAVLQKALNGIFSQPEFNAIVDEVLDTYPPTSARESVRNEVKNWMGARRTTVQNLINGLVPPATNNPVATISGAPRSPTPFASATLTVGGNSVTHYRYRLNNGSFGADTPVATAITLSGLPDGSTNTVYVVGRNAAGVYQEAANATASRTWVVKTSTPAVRLNEVLAHNVTAVAHNGTFPDVIELYNEGGSAVDLAGFRLTDDPANPNKFVFPSDAILAGGAYLAVYANNDDGTPGLHTGFALNQTGETLYLYDRISNGGAQLDSVTFGLQVADLSIGRIQGGDWELTQPTFGSANLAQPLGQAAGLKINEWQTAGAVPFVDDFIEVYNPDALPVALGGLHLTDEPIGAPALHRISDLSFVEGAGFVAFLADGNPGAGADHLGFQLSSQLGEIGLNAADLSTIDCISYGPQRTGIAQGRCPDGADAFTFLDSPTPGGPNLCPVTPPPPETVLILIYSSGWKYDQTDNLDGVPWTAPGYNDSAWPTGAGVLAKLRNGGSIPEPVRTVLTLGRATYYFRTQFIAPKNTNVTSLQVTHLIDDGAVLYLNGQEIYRYNISSGSVGYNTLASAVNGDPTYQGPVVLPATAMVPGVNHLAIEVHQSSLSSADIIMGLKLDGLIVTNVASSAGVVINEVAANNPPGGASGGTSSDWMELYNPSSSAVNLDGLSLGRSPATNGPRWYFPPSSIIPAQGYLVVEFDGDLPVSGTNTGYGLKASGDSIYLFNRPGESPVTLDFINFGLQIEEFTIGRVPNGGPNWTLTLPSYAGPNSVAPTGDPLLLKVNEWMANPLSGDDWFEIFNPDSQPVALGGLYLTDDYLTDPTKSPIPPLSFLGILTNAYQMFHADNNPGSGADHVSFKLNAAEQRLGIVDATGRLIDGYDYGQQDPGVSEGRLPDGGPSIVRFPVSASPGAANYLPLTDIIINELLAHTDLPLEDAIEFQNVSANPVDVSGWYLSDSKRQPRKYLIPDGTIVPPGGFKVFYEYQFNDTNYLTTAFAFSSAKGDQAYLFQATSNGNLTGYRASVAFGPSANGVSFGRYLTSQGQVEFTAMSALSLGTVVTAQSPPDQIDLFRTGLGAPNPYPKVGPIVISEIMYHPPDITSLDVTNDNVVEEYVELHNITADTVPLYDPAYPTNGWRLRKGVDLQFNSSHSIPPGGNLLAVSFNPATDMAALAQFSAKYGSNLFLVGPYSGKLDNGGESVELVRPDTPQLIGPDLGLVPYILVDKVDYLDQAPWPPGADGLGLSLHRISFTGYGNDPTNWMAALPAPGGSGITDVDGDGLPDDWEMAYFQTLARDGTGDFDGDGLTDFEEYLAGTDPTDPASGLSLSVSLNGGTLDLTFTAAAGKTYTVQYCYVLPNPGPWFKLMDVPAQLVTQAVVVHDNSISGDTQRFYRIITPAAP
jgi:Lamin Tail Domain/CotH kinase protein/Bacterial TSP3 repeat